MTQEKKRWIEEGIEEGKINRFKSLEMIEIN